MKLMILLVVGLWFVGGAPARATTECVECCPVSDNELRTSGLNGLNGDSLRMLGGLAALESEQFSSEGCEHRAGAIERKVSHLGKDLVNLLIDNSPGILYGVATDDWKLARTQFRVSLLAGRPNPATNSLPVTQQVYGLMARSGDVYRSQFLLGSMRPRTEASFRLSDADLHTTGTSIAYDSLTYDDVKSHLRDDSVAAMSMRNDAGDSRSPHGSTNAERVAELPVAPPRGSTTGGGLETTAEFLLAPLASGTHYLIPFRPAQAGEGKEVRIVKASSGKEIGAAYVVGESRDRVTQVRLIEARSANANQQLFKMKLVDSAGDEVTAATVSSVFFD